MIDPANLLVFIGSSLVLLLSPGPAVLYVIAAGLGRSRRGVFSAVAGLGLGGAVLVALAAAGLSALLATSEGAFRTLKLIGALVLFGLGIQTLRSRTAAGDPETDPRSTRRLFLGGLATNALNPKAAIFLMAFLPQFTDPERGSIPVQILVLGAVFLGLAWICDSIYGLLAYELRTRWMVPRARPWLERWIPGVALITLGIAAALSPGIVTRRLGPSYRTPAPPSARRSEPTA